MPSPIRGAQLSRYDFDVVAGSARGLCHRRKAALHSVEQTCTSEGSPLYTVPESHPSPDSQFASS